MSQEEAELSGKAKKAKRSEERFKKGKKRKRDVATEDAEAGDPSAPAKEQSRKRRRSEDGSVEVNAEDGQKAVSKVRAKQNDDGTASKKRKKQKTTAAKDPEEAGGASEGTDGAATAATEQTPAKQRFIVFIGNLPFTTTTDMIEKHFASITPASTRHITDPQTKKSKGYAFLEFSNFDRMKTCLKLYHHSTFDTGIGGEKGKRRINVELTAGGGGSKSEGRKEKLKEKNQRLEEQRQRRAEALQKQEKRKAQKEGRAKKAPAAQAGKPEPDEVEGAVEEDADSGMHPARLARLQGGR